MAMLVAINVYLCTDELSKGRRGAKMNLTAIYGKYNQPSAIYIIHTIINIYRLN